MQFAWYVALLPQTEGNRYRSKHIDVHKDTEVEVQINIYLLIYNLAFLISLQSFWNYIWLSFTICIYLDWFSLKVIIFHGLMVLAVKNPPANAGDMGSISGLGRAPGERNDNSLQYSCQKNPMARGAWQITVHWVTKNGTWLTLSPYFWAS